MSESQLKAEDFIEVSSKFFKVLCFNPIAKLSQGTSRIDRFLGYLKKVVFYTLLVNSLIGFLVVSIVTAVTFWHRKDYLELLGKLPGILVASGSFIMASTVRSNRVEFANIVQTLNDLLPRNWTDENSEAMEAYKNFKKFARITLVIAFASIIGFACIPIAQLFFNTQVSYSLWVLVFANIYSLILRTSFLLILCGYFLLLFGFVTLISAEFKMVAQKFEKINVARHDVYAQIVDLITQHCELMKVAEKLQEIFSLSIFFHFFSSSIIICFGCFQLTVSDVNFVDIYRFLCFAIFQMLQMLALCFYAQKLIDSSASIGDGAYNMEWYSIEDLRIKKLIQLVILRAQKHQKMSAMKFADVSLECYATVSKKYIKMTF
jgi:hypothetical protein